MIHNQSSGKSRLIKQIISLGIAFLLICSVIIPAFAADVGSDGEPSEAQAAESTVQGIENLALEEVTAPADSSDEQNTEIKETIPAADPTKAPEDTGKVETADQEITSTPQPVPTVTYNFYLEGELYSSQVVQNGEPVVQPENPAADGKIFSGWYTAPDENGQRFEAFGAPSANGTENVTLYGRWENDSNANENETEPEESAETIGLVGNEPGSLTEAAVGIAAELEDDGIAPFAIDDPREVAIGSTITLTGGRGYSHSWESSNESCATVSGNGANAVVTGIAAGTVTITHSYYSGVSRRSETYTVTVTGSVGEERALVYYLKTPTSNPDSNDTDQWGENVGTAIVNTDGAVWTNNKNIFNPSDYVVSWPDGTPHSGESWLMPKEGNEKHYRAIYDKYRATLEAESELGVTLDYDDIEEIYLTPYKISKNNGSSPDKHIDCTISVKTKKVFAAVFWVTDPDGTVRQVDAKNYVTGSSIEKTGRTQDPTKTENGITYVFDGWYNEAGEKVTEDRWPYTPNETELFDGTVNFYARYVPQNVSVNVSKSVTGGLGDKTKDFSFTVNVKSGNRDAGFKIGDTEYTGTADFTLRDSQTVTLNVPAGASITITEADYSSERYTTSYAVGGSNSVVGNTAVINSVGTDGGTVAFTNHKDVIPDTGLNLTAAPYILIAVFAAVGGFMLISRRKRRI